MTTVAGAYRFGFALVVIVNTAPAQTLVNPSIVEREGLLTPRTMVPRAIADSLAARTPKELMGAYDAAMRFARDSSTKFQEAMQLYSRFPGTFTRAADRPYSPERALALALVADDATAMRKIAARFQGSPEDSMRMESDARALRQELRLVRSRATTQVLVFADGNIKGAASGAPSDGPVGTGSLGVSLQRGQTHWTASIAVASTSDTITSGFGASLLSPASGKRLFSGLIDLRTMLRNQPLHIYLTSSKSTWRMTNSANDTISLDAVMFGAGALRYWDLANGYVGDNYVALRLEAGGAMRWMTGDIVDSTANVFRKQNLGTQKRHFAGIEGGMQISFGRVTAATQVYYLRTVGRLKSQVRGLTRGQIVAGLSVAGDIFRGSY